jgi:hypothetical protein
VNEWLEGQEEEQPVEEESESEGDDAAGDDAECDQDTKDHINGVL